MGDFNLSNINWIPVHNEIFLQPTQVDEKSSSEQGLRLYKPQTTYRKMSDVGVITSILKWIRSHINEYFVVHYKTTGGPR